MAISHVCLECGFDLARVRPERDPHYGLNLVICPRCGRACVRRRHPVDRQVRNLRRTLRSMWGLLGNAIATVVLLYATLESWPAIWGILVETLTAEESYRDYLMLGTVPLWALLVLLSGIWIAAPYSHWSRGRIWLVWVGALLFIALSPTLYILVDGVYSRLIGDPKEAWLRMPSWPWKRLAGVVVIGVIMLTGVPVGSKVRLAYSHHRHVRWCRRRRRMRAWRSAE